MKVNRIESKIIVIAIGFAVLSWIMESSVETLVFKNGSFIGQILTMDPHEIWSRSVAMGIIILFGVYAQLAVTKRKRVEHTLNERVKELGCLYGITNIAAKTGITLDEIYQEATNLLPPSWQYPEITCARVIAGGSKFETGNYRDTGWKQSSDIKVYGENIGIVEVGYLEKRPEIDEGPFLKEERSLISAVAIQLGNITESKRMEEELSQYSENLVQKVEERTKELQESQERLLTSERMAMLGQFSGSISHELRNPLGVIDSSAYYLKAKLKDADKKVEQHLDRIQSSVSSANAIIESLLNLTRMKEPQLGGTDLLAVTRDAITTSKVPSAVNVVRNFPRQMVLVIADREQLRMAFKNIVKNALEAMDGKGTLTVAVQSTDEGHAEVSFTDTGSGIAAENLEKIFDPLFTTKATGIGFGLSIAKMIINKHSGMVEATSEPGKGATIILRLPLYKEASKEE